MYTRLIWFAALWLIFNACGEADAPADLAQRQATPPAHQDQWAVFLRQSATAPSVITLDLSWKKTAPVENYSRLFTATIFAEDLLPTGFPTDSETRIADELQQQLIRELEGGQYGLFIGSQVAPGAKTLYFYLKAEAAAEQLAQQLVKDYQKRQVEAAISPDKRWETYINTLSPSLKEQAEIRNDQVLLQLQQAGDALNQPRLIEHWAYFPSPAARQQFQDTVAAASFKILGFDTIDVGKAARYGIHMARQDSIHVPYIHQLTWNLTRFAESLGGSYDGWETVVVKK